MPPTLVPYRACALPDRAPTFESRSCESLAPVHIRGSAAGNEGSEGVTMPVMTLFRSTIEHEVPDWVEQARRLGGLLIGVGSQAGRPVSLALWKVWHVESRRPISSTEVRAMMRTSCEK